MVKKRIFAVVIVLVVTLMAIYIAINVTYKRHFSDCSRETKITTYTDKIEYDRLPDDCITILNDHYAICKDIVELQTGSTQQYNDVGEYTYLYNIKTGKRELINECITNNISLKHIIEGDRIFWIEQLIYREETTSGKWAIKEYNIKSKKTNIIDEGEFEDFKQYAYKDIDFSDANMLFPTNIDVHGNKLTYNRVVDIGGQLNFEIILYDVKSKNMEIIASGKNYISEYYYDVAINEKYVIYNKYHEKNIDNSFRNTTYKYCDLYLYDIEKKHTKEIIKNDFIINLDINNKFVLAARVPENEAGQDIFARMQLILIDVQKESKTITLSYKSPIYKGKKDLQIGNPTFVGKYIVWQDNSTINHMNMYNYKSNEFVKIPTLDNGEELSIVSAADNSLMVLGLNKDGKDFLYRVKIK